MSDFRFRSISWELTDRISPNFVYALIFTRSRLGLLPVTFRKFETGLWPLIYFRILIYVKISFPLNILEHGDRISPNFIHAFILTRFTFELLHIIFRTFVPELWLLIGAKFSFPLNILRTNSQNFTNFDACIHIDKICNTSFFADLFQN